MRKYLLTASDFHFSLSCTGEGNGNPLQCSCLENPRDGGLGDLPDPGSDPASLVSPALQVDSLLHGGQGRPGRLVDRPRPPSGAQGRHEYPISA